MDTVASRPGAPSADLSLINTDFIRRLQEQRVLHKQEVAFHLSEVEKHGAADEALASMIQAAEKVMAIMFPAAAVTAAPYEAPAEAMSAGPGFAEAAMNALPKAAAPQNYNEPPANHEHADFMAADDRTGAGGNSWRMKLMRSSS